MQKDLKSLFETPIYEKKMKELTGDGGVGGGGVPRILRLLRAVLWEMPVQRYLMVQVLRLYLIWRIYEILKYFGLVVESAW
jgi:hypothetical protein